MDNASTVRTTRTQLMIETECAQPVAPGLPRRGVALVRIDTLLRNAIGTHPLAIAHPERIADARTRARLSAMFEGYSSGSEMFIDRLADEIARAVEARHPKTCIVCMSSLASDEYSELIGGEIETGEANPSLGLRGASRYLSDEHREEFALECEAIRRVRARLGLTSIAVAVPFVRTLGDADRVLEALSASGLRRGDAGLEIHLWCDVPSNVLVADLFAERFDGFIVDTDELCHHLFAADQNTVALDRVFDECDVVVRRTISSLSEGLRRSGTRITVRGSAVTRSKELVEFLVETGVDSIAVSPDRFMAVHDWVGAAEARMEERMPADPSSVLDCPQGMVGVLFIDEMMPPNSAAGIPAATAYPVPNVGKRTRRVRAFERND